MALGGTEQAVVTNLDEARREHVLEEATNELLGGKGALLELVSGRLFVSEGDLAIMQLAQTVVAEGDAKDVRSEILEGRCTAADRLRMDHPVLNPTSAMEFRKMDKRGRERSGFRVA